MKAARKRLLLLLPLALLGGLGWALGTSGGLRFVLARAESTLAAHGGALRVAEVRGSIVGGIELAGIELEVAEVRVSVARLQADLRALPLLVGKLGLERLELDVVRVVLPPQPDPTPFVLPPRIELPLHIAIDRFAAHDLAIATGATPLLALDTVEARASADARGFRVEDARVAAQGLGADGSLAMANAAPYPLEGALRLRLERPDLPPIAGNAQLSGRLEAMRLALGLEAPLAARADLALDDPFGAKRVSGRIEVRDADLAPLFGEPAAGWRVDAELALDGTLATPRIEGRLAARRADLPELRAGLAAGLVGKTLQLERLKLTAAGTAAELDARGHVTLDGPRFPFALEMSGSHPRLRSLTLAVDGDLDLAKGPLRVRDHASTLDAELSLRARRRHAELAGKFDDWPLPGGGTFGANAFDVALTPGAAQFSIGGAARRGTLRAEYTLEGKADRERLTLDAFVLKALGGEVTADGRIELAGAQRLQATLRAHDIDPRGLDPRFPGRLAAEVRLGGSVTAPVIALTALSGELRGRKVGGHARLRHGRAAELVALGLPSYVLESLELTAGSAHAAGHVHAGSAALRVDAPDLADLLPEARGSVVLEAARAGDGALDGHATARGVALGTARLATLDATLAAPAAGRIAGELKAGGLSAGDVALDELRLNADGDRGDLALGLEAAREGARFSAAARGALRAGGFVGELTRWELAPVEAEHWTLAAPAALRVGRDGAALTKACASDGAARACVDGAWHPLDPWHATLSVADLGIAAFRGYLPRGLAYAGDVDLDAQVAGTGPTLGTVRAELTLSSGSIEATVRRASKAPATRLIEFNGGRVLLERNAERLRALFDLKLGAGGSIDAELEARGHGPFDERPLSGRVRAQVEQFALLPVLLPEVKQLSGKLDADLTVTGVVGAPRFAGSASFRGGSASVPRFGIELSAFELELEGDGDALALKGDARAGGRLDWQATLRRGADGWSADGTLKGERFRALNTPEARVIASPDLALHYAGDRLSVTGTVAVPEARIAPRSLASAVQASSDEVLVGDDAGVATEGALVLDARVHVALGSDVDFEGFGLKAGIEGGLTLTEKPGSLTLASGELALVDGKYEAYGQQLAIRRGKLLFSGGPVADPGLDIRAQRLVERPGADDLTVGIDVRGTLRRPETSLFSDPAMSSSEQLSYLVLGRSLSESTEGDQQLLGDAAQSMKLSGGELLAQQIGRRIGLDEVKIEDEGDQEDAQLWLGTYLSPRLFVSYGIGLFEDFYSAKVRYDITTKWTVEAESGRESSADLKYTIER